MINAGMWQWIGITLGVIAPGTGKLAIVAFILQLQSRTNFKKKSHSPRDRMVKYDSGRPSVHHHFPTV